MLAAFVAPYFTDNAKHYLHHLAIQPGVRLATVGQEPRELLPRHLREAIAHHVHVEDALTSDAIVGAFGAIERALGRPDLLLGVVEQLQVPLGEARERLGLPGMRAEHARNFRDKTVMKDLLRDAGVPVARHRLVPDTASALAFAAEVGFPLVVKPPGGAAAQTTYRATDEESLRRALGPASASAGGAVLLEELVSGEEHSFDAFVKDGRVVFYSVSSYHPTPLAVMENPWMQWTVVLPRDHRAEDIATLGERALQVLGLRDGMCHLEWFRRPDGSVVVSEVGARPPGAQFSTLISRAHDADCMAAWARLSLFGEVTPMPERKYAAGAAYLRGHGEGRVRAVHGWDAAARELGDLVTDVRLPKPGQAKSISYEGEGFVIVRHPETRVVEEALRHVISTVRVELG